ncbi:MAG: DNA-binding NarL/FixJ family response regulator [Candidatus Omnitrophota bacterium]|jgi:DNA-binding NarL/FixJ family response regulator
MVGQKLDLNTIRVGLVDDNTLVLAGIASLVSTAEGLVIHAASISTAVDFTAIISNPPDVLVMDVNFSGGFGIAFLSRLRQRIPKLQILILTLLEDDGTVYDSIRSGANGYLLKNDPELQIIAAIHDVHGGGSPMTSSIARKAVQFIQVSPEVKTDESKEVASLSPREKEVMACLTDGLRYKEIAVRLNIGAETVHTHLKRCYGKLKVTSRTEAVVKFLKGRPAASV